MFSGKISFVRNTVCKLFVRGKYFSSYIIFLNMIFNLLSVSKN